MSQKLWIVIGGAAAVIAVAALLVFGFNASGDKVSESASVPGDESGQTTGGGNEAPAASAEQSAPQPDDGSAEPLPKGPDLPSLSGEDLVTGETLNIRDFADGKPLVIQMWASWCHICDESGGEVKRFVDERTDVNYVGIDVQDQKGPGRGFADKHGWTHPSIFDEGDFAQTFGLRGTPTYIFVHADGTIAGQSVGDPGYEGLNRIADRLVASS